MCVRVGRGRGREGWDGTREAESHGESRGILRYCVAAALDEGGGECQLLTGPIGALQGPDLACRPYV